MKKMYNFFIRSFLCIILFLILAILCKKNVEYKEYIHGQIYQQNMSFSSFKNFYNRYLGGIFPIENVIRLSADAVFNEKMMYQQVNAYEDGAKLTVQQNYLVPNMEEGIVVYIGEKKKYHQVVIVENSAGIDIWYGNLSNVNVKLYDHIGSGAYLGEADGNFIYLVYTKENRFLNYQDYLK